MKNKRYIRTAVVNLAFSLGMLTIPSIIQAREEKTREPIVLAQMALDGKGPVSYAIGESSDDAISLYQVLAGGLLGLALVSRRKMPAGTDDPGTDSSGTT